MNTLRRPSATCARAAAVTSAGARDAPSEGRATGAPNGFAPYASGGKVCVPAVPERSAISIRCFAVPRRASPWGTGGCPWGASGRWFKSSRPDNPRTRHPVGSQVTGSTFSGARCALRCVFAAARSGWQLEDEGQPCHPPLKTRSWYRSSRLDSEIGIARCHGEPEPGLARIGERLKDAWVLQVSHDEGRQPG